MLGDYLQYNAKPVDWTAPPEKKQDRERSREKPVQADQLPDYARAQDTEDGYDPYNHPIGRHIIEKHQRRNRR